MGTRGASNTYDYLIIRGFAADGQSQNNYLNGLKMQGNFYNDAVIDPYMLERAEIMRGPVSVLYGKSSPGGLLNMVSKRPTTEPLKEVQFKAGTDSLFQTGFDFSDALDDDGVYSYRLTGLARSANAQQKGLKSSVMLLLQRLPGVRMIKPIFTPDENKVTVKETVSQVSARSILLCDSSKYNQVATFMALPLTRFTTIITDRHLSDAAAAHITRHACEVLRAG